MTLWIDRTPLDGLVAQHLRRICPDPGMSFDIAVQAASATHVASGRVVYPSSRRTQSSVGCDLIAALVDLPAPICIAAQRPDYVLYPADPVAGRFERKLREFQGATKPNRVPTKAPLPTSVVVIYDPTDDGGRGYFCYDEQFGQDGKNASLGDEILFHELSHARDIYAGRWIGISRDEYLRRGEAAAIEAENLYLVSKNRRRRGPGGGTGHKVDGPGTCFIATAAYGSPVASEVDQLRQFRDGVLKTTQVGAQFFDDFYREYCRFSPPLAEMVRQDPKLAEIVRFGLISPLASYLRLAMALPHAPIEDVPEPWRGFLSQLVDDYDRWMSGYPIPHDFEGLTSLEALREIRVLLRYVLRAPVAREAWLSTLRERGQLPLLIAGPARMEIENELAEDGCTEAELEKVLGR